jgi:hypothetical protein
MNFQRLDFDREAVSNGLTVRSVRGRLGESGTDVDSCLCWTRPSDSASSNSPALATSPSRQPREASHETSIELRCGCGPIA